MDLPPVYVINMRSRPDRLETITKELGHHGVTHYHIVQAVTPEHPEVLWFGKELDMGEPRVQGAKRINEICCFASHIHALRKIAKLHDETTASDYGGIVMEDDTLPAKGFANLFREIRQNYPKEWDLVSLCPNMAPKTYLEKWAGLVPHKRNIAAIDCTIQWGTVAYHISTRFARVCLHVFDRPLVTTRFNPNLLTSELFSSICIPYTTIPFLAIEDPINSSCIRQRMGENTNFSIWGIDNYGIGNWRERLRQAQKLIERRSWSDAFSLLETIDRSELSVNGIYIYIISMGACAFQLKEAGWFSLIRELFCRHVRENPIIYNLAAKYLEDWSHLVPKTIGA